MAMRIEELVERVDRLPVTPSVHARVQRMVRDADASVRELSEAILGDPSLTAQVLRLANSAAYGRSRTVGTVSQAVVLLGFETIGRQVLAPAQDNPTERGAGDGAFDFGAFREHSVGVAAGARLLARRAGHADEEAVYVAGLLHDIGRVAMAEQMPVELEEAVDRAWRLRTSLVEAERRTIGFTHCRVGACLAARWDLPELVEDAVAFHHGPDLTERHNLETRMVEAADVLAKAMSLGYSGDDRVGSISKRTRELLQLETDELEGLLEAIRAESGQLTAPEADGADQGENPVKGAAKSADAIHDR